MHTSLCIILQFSNHTFKGNTNTQNQGNKNRSRINQNCIRIFWFGVNFEFLCPVEIRKVVKNAGILVCIGYDKSASFCAFYE